MKKNIARLIIFALVLATAGSLLALPAIAADVVNRWFYFDNPADPTSATIVEGQGIKMIMKQPQGMILSTQNSLIMRTDSDDPVVGNDIIEIRSATGGEYYINAYNGAAGTYKVQGNFYSRTMDGTATETYIYYYPDPNDPDKTLSNNIRGSAKVSSFGEVPITQDSTINLTCNFSGEGVQPQLTVDAATPPTGTFTGYNDVAITNVTPYKGTETIYKHTYTITVGTVGQDNKISLALTTDRLIDKDTKFNIMFATKKSEMLLLTVRSRKQLVDDVAAAIGKPIQRDPYILFADGDTPEFVFNNFKMLASRVKVYGVYVDLDWKWTVDDKPDKTIEIGKATNTNILPTKINRQKDDVTGKLVATVSYKGSGTDEKPEQTFATLLLTVRGTGTPPSVELDTTLLDLNNSGLPEFPPAKNSKPEAAVKLNMGLGGLCHPFGDRP